MLLVQGPLAVQLRKPVDSNIEHFWIDFNIGRHSISFIIDTGESSFWDTVTLGKDVINMHSLKEVDNQIVLVINLKNPLTINSKPITKVKILFETQFDIQSVINKVFGDSSMGELVSEIKIKSIESSTVAEKTEHISTSESTFLEWKREKLIQNQTDSASDILSSQLSDQSMAVLVSSNTTTTEKSQVTDDTLQITVEAAPESMPVSKSAVPVVTQEPCDQPMESLEVIEGIQKEPSTVSASCGTGLGAGELERTKQEQHVSPCLESQDDRNCRQGKSALTDRNKKRKSNSKKHTDGAKEQSCEVDQVEILDNQPIQTCTPERPKRRRTSARNIANSKETGDTYGVHNVFDSPSYEKQNKYPEHLFSDTNKTESNQSDESWVLEYKKSRSKSADYTRKKPRSKRKLKVLPLSSPSDADDHPRKKIGGIVKSTPIIETRLKKGKRNTSALECSGVLVPDVSAILSSGDSKVKTAGEYYHSEEQHADDDLLHAACPSPTDSDIFDNAPTAQYSSTSTALLKSGFVREDEVPKFKQDLTDPQFADPEDALDPDAEESSSSDSSFITVFENFSKSLKKRLLSRHERMKMHAQKTAKTSEQHMTALLKEVHHSRLATLNNFHTVVLQEVDHLEKETQFLKETEKATVDFCNEQSEKLKSFCEMQQKRLKVMYPKLEESTKIFTEVLQTTTDVEHQLDTVGETDH